MESKLKFDLNGQDEYVVTAQIVYTDDVRDKVARRFYENLGYDSNLAVVRILPESNSYNSVLAGSAQVRLGDEVKVKGLEIRTVSGDPESTLAWLKELTQGQLEMMLKNIPVALKWKKTHTAVE